MIVRMLPYFQLREGSLVRNGRVSGKCSMSHSDMSEDFINVRKEFGSSFMTLMDAKFVFKHPFYYFEVHGSA
jgi:hypothetical protein